jgi:D-lactate dehydrogenase (cytochrome)
MDPLIRPLSPDFTDYLHDESRLSGRAETISFPRGEEEVREVLRQTAAADTPVTVQGGRTGITGGAVPRGGHVLNLGRLDRILELGSSAARVQPGVPLSALNAALAAQHPALFFPPDPTEATATLGGMAATNASGARSFAYGPTRAHVQALRVVLADGSALSLSRGHERARGGSFRLAADSGRVLAGNLPSYPLPEVKNAAGLFVRPDMDLLDLFIGCEGTLGVITELELRLSALPPCIWACLAFFPREVDALRYVDALRTDALAGGARPAAIEYFDRQALGLLAEELAAYLPSTPEAEACLYVEYHQDREPGEEELLAMLGALERFGSGEKLAWTADTPRELELLKGIRHALPEKVNRVIAERQRRLPDITKLGTDLAVPAAALGEAMAMYHRDLASSGLEHVLFGHIGDSHVHANILPRSAEEYHRGRELYARWAEAVIAWGGTISAEHGVGKIKVELLRKMYGADSIDGMRRLIECFNPGRRLNQGNMIS